MLVYLKRIELMPVLGSLLDGTCMCILLVLYSETSNNLGNDGSSIYLTDDSTLEVYDSSFKDNQAKRLGAGIIALKRSSVSISNTAFSNNSGIEGASINVQQHTSLDVHNATFTSNVADAGAGINTLSQTDIYITDSVFSNNTGRQGAGIDAQYSRLHITDSLFEYNTANQGGAILIEYLAHLSAIRCKFYENKAFDVYKGTLQWSPTIEHAENRNTQLLEKISNDGKNGLKFTSFQYSKPSSSYFLNRTIANSIGFGGALLVASTASANLISCMLTLTLLYHISTYVVLFLTGSVLYHISTYVVFCDWCGMVSGTLFITPSAPQLFFSFLFYEKYLKYIFHGGNTMKKQKTPKIFPKSSEEH